MSKTIGLYYELPDRTVGCKKVVENLLKGLKQLNVSVATNTNCELTGCLHGAMSHFKNKTLPKNTLIGPEILVLPSENPSAFQFWKNWVQPSQWVVDYMRTFQITQHNNLLVWPVGIDTEMFTDTGRGNWQYDCFVYYKTVTHQVSTEQLNAITNSLSLAKLRYKVITYGSYDEKELIEASKISKCAIFLTGTESQGIAYMEVFAMNCPIYFIECNQFKYRDFTFKNNNVSAAPYMDDKCGIKVPGFDIRTFTQFLNGVDQRKYNPREYVSSQHNLRIGAQRYMDILETCK